MERSYLLIGGCNIDYIAKSDKAIIKKTSNVGKVSITFGGVMRNIATNLARLGNNIDFITAIGNDGNGDSLKEELLNLGINLILPTSNLPTGSYVAILDKHNDLSEAVCDNRIINEITPEFLELHKDLFDKHDVILLDTNVSQETIDYIMKKYSNKKIIVDAISPNKVMKLKDYLDKLYLIKCNIHEARALMGIDLVEKDLVSGLLARGAKNVVVSNGAHDIYFGSDYKKVDLVKVLESKDFINTTGCGDALTSGVVDYYLTKHTLKESVAFGNECAQLTLMNEGATTPEISKLKH